MSEELLTCRGIGKAFGGIQALTDVGFSIAPGEIYGLIGPNGAGKTTLFNILTGIYAPDAGSVLFQGRQLAGLKSHQIVRLGIANASYVARHTGEAAGSPGSRPTRSRWVCHFPPVQCIPSRVRPPQTLPLPGVAVPGRLLRHSSHPRPEAHPPPEWPSALIQWKSSRNPFNLLGI